RRVCIGERKYIGGHDDVISGPFSPFLASLRYPATFSTIPSARAISSICTPLPRSAPFLLVFP
ncbi:MAG: hypothetical protein O7B35_16890, partial [Deltaproteobacteria bacterium]|nr:hypothetical protein [Deltaproteobacteria bacterium]